MTPKLTSPQRWTTAIAKPTEHGGFVAFGDYLELVRAATALELELIDARSVIAKAVRYERARYMAAMQDADTIIGHDDVGTEWREKSETELALRDICNAAGLSAELNEVLGELAELRSALACTRRAIDRACAGYPENATAPTCVAILREALGGLESRSQAHLTP